jgi:1-deoxyxylulose-5-phosphate synthase
MDRAFELGIRLFDTAVAYGERHSSEKIVGRWLRSRGVRDQIVLLTKKSRKKDWQASVRDALCASLDRLQTDRADVYLYHQFDPSAQDEEAAMDEVIRAGLARIGGCSNYSAAQLCRALEVSQQNGLRRFQVIESIYNLAVPGIAEDLLPFCRREQIGVLTYSPLGAGFLTGKYTGDRAAFPARSRFHVAPGHADIYFSDRNFRLVDRLHAFAASVQLPPSRLAMAWVFQNSDVTTALVGATRIEHLNNAVDSLEMEFPPGWLTEMNSWD